MLSFNNMEFNSKIVFIVIIVKSMSSFIIMEFIFKIVIIFIIVISML